MRTIRVGDFENTFVIHFGGHSHRINAYTLASALVGFADAAKAANATINPGFEIEVVVEALSEGSFKATIRAFYNEARNIFSSEPVKAITYSVIGAFIYQHTLAPDQTININTTNEEVVIEQGDTRIIVPRQVHEAVKEVEKTPKFRKGISDAIRAVESDKEVSSIGFSESPQAESPQLPIPREQFTLLTTEANTNEEEIRELFEITDLQIMRAILERSGKLWQFGWNGLRISAPITDHKFYDDFFSHRVTIAPGDVLRVRLKIRQKLDVDLGIYLNQSYEVVHVIDHIERKKQTTMAGL
ncbi:MAG: hypothetical protein JAZ06_02435 [Candidatus Thiodiazotropha taylori]|nr:hypothetical protein [Candidatus Thiodiazotropha taylori]